MIESYSSFCEDKSVSRAKEACAEKKRNMDLSPSEPAPSLSGLTMRNADDATETQLDRARLKPYQARLDRKRQL